MTVSVSDAIHVMIVEDVRASVAELEDLLNGDSQYEHSVVSFEEARERIGSEHPDIVVTDLLDEKLHDSGNQVVDFVWTRHFCPIVIYSAYPGRAALPTGAHRLVSCRGKGIGSEQEVYDDIRRWAPCAAAIRRGHEENRTLFRDAVRESATRMMDLGVDAANDVDGLFRASRRRFAAALDERPTDEAGMEAWEAYLCPPLSSSLCTGDILRRARGKVDRPEDFAVVLTPSCDLAAAKGRSPKVHRVLVAKCVSTEDGLQLCGLSLPKEFKDTSSVIRTLRQGYREGVLFLPPLRGEIPGIAATLRGLELIPLEDVVERGGDRPYWRVASVDSPYRELVSWAYLQNAARPGLPDRRVRSWFEEVRRERTADGGAS